MKVQRKKGESRRRRNSSRMKQVSAVILSAILAFGSAGGNVYPVYAAELSNENSTDGSEAGEENEDQDSGSAGENSEAGEEGGSEENSGSNEGQEQEETGEENADQGGSESGEDAGLEENGESEGEEAESEENGESEDGSESGENNGSEGDSGSGEDSEETEGQTEETPETEQNPEIDGGGANDPESPELPLESEEVKPEETDPEEIVPAEPLMPALPKETLEAVKVPEKEAEKPEFEYSEEIGDVTITISAAEGVLPEGTTVEIEELDAELATPSEAEKKETEEESQETSFQYLLTFYDEDGEKMKDDWNQDGIVTVTFSGSAIDEAKEAASEVSFVYINDSGREKKTDTISLADAEEREFCEIIFEAKHSAVYRLEFSGERKTGEYRVGTWDELRNAVTGINNQDTGKYEIYLTDDIEIPKVQETLRIKNNEATLFGCGHTITYLTAGASSNADRVLGATNGATFNLGAKGREEESRLTVTIDDPETSSFPQALVNVYDSGMVNMYEGVVLEKSHSTSSLSGGVEVKKEAVFNMYGGEIRDNATDFSCGGGVAVAMNGTFNMYGGVIEGNFTESSFMMSTSYGGGVYVNESVFNMYGGVIQDNYVKENKNISYGGGVAVVGDSQFHMFDGTIQNNRIEKGHGGGVAVYSGSEFTMSGGTIADNNAEYDGGGVYVYKNCSAVLNKGTISGNQAQCGGGAAVIESSFEMNKQAVIKENQATAVSAKRLAQRGGGIYLSYKKETSVSGKAVSEEDELKNDKSRPSEKDSQWSMSIKGGTIKDNVSSAYGGGVACFNGAVDISDCVIEGNKAIQGGGICAYTADERAATTKPEYLTKITLNNVTVQDNQVEKTGSDNAKGAGIYLCDSYNVQITDCSISGNQTGESGSGGGIYAEATSGINAAADTAGVIVSGCTIAHNQSADGGAGILLGDYAKDRELEITVTGTAITNNEATGSNGRGGGISLGAGRIEASDSQNVICNNWAKKEGSDIWTNYPNVNITLPDAASMNQIYEKDGKGNKIDGWYWDEDYPTDGTVRYEPAVGGVPEKLEDIKEYAILVASYALKNEYMVTFKPGEHGIIDPQANPGADGTLSQSYPIDSPFPTPPNTIADTGYVFDGWYDETNTHVEVFPEKVTRDCVYTAHWKEDSKPDPTKKTGDLQVLVTVSGSGAELDHMFDFTVSLSDKTINGTYGEMTFENGEAHFSLKHGQSKTAEDLPAGISYTVTESDNEGYTVTASGAEGMIPENAEAEAVFNDYKGSSSGGGDNTGGGGSHGGGGSSGGGSGTPGGHYEPETGGPGVVEKADPIPQEPPALLPDPVPEQPQTVPSYPLPKTGQTGTKAAWITMISGLLTGILLLERKRKGEKE